MEPKAVSTTDFHWQDEQQMYNNKKMSDFLYFQWNGFGNERKTLV